MGWGQDEKRRLAAPGYEASAGESAGTAPGVPVIEPQVDELEKLFGEVEERQARILAGLVGVNVDKDPEGRIGGRPMPAALTTRIHELKHRALRILDNTRAIQNVLLNEK